ncbi:MAG: DUF1385 domain-containing protein [Firmicutes bacterium]|nr:DUF1385 domain-containing protein [Bacillota bacterium]
MDVRFGNRARVALFLQLGGWQGEPSRGVGELGSDFQYGGQAVIEGVMMRGQTSIAIAVRRQDHEITVREKPIGSLTARWPFLRWPVIRGVVMLVESLVIGIQALMFSANEFAGGEGEEKLKPWELTGTIVFAMALFVGLFIVLPNLFAVAVQKLVHNVVAVNLLEGLFRIFIFLAYIFAVSRIKDIQRVFEYHGAEHKTIHTYEAGEELTVENARKHSTLHPRCGTSFLLIVMVIMIIAFSLIGRRAFLPRIALRLAMLPVVAGLSYEVIKATGRKHVAKWVRWAIAPGLWLQKLTTREPDNEQLEVAIKALESVLEKKGDAFVGPA